MMAMMLQARFLRSGPASRASDILCTSVDILRP